MKKTIISLSLGILILSSCNNASKTGAQNPNDSTQMTEHIGEHTFACPMHPLEIGKEGDNCSKCGMKLVHNDNAGKDNGNTYKMNYSALPSPIESGKQTVLSLSPQIVGKEKELVPLDIEHEKKIHFIMVNEDLSWFDHQHPEYTNAGTYDLPYTFKNGGRYMLFADYKPTGASHQLEKINVEVKGKTTKPTVYKDARMVSKIGEFEVSLSTGENNRLFSGSTQHLKGVITKAGKPVDANTLENYLGAKAHMVVIGIDDKNYLHVHPGVDNGNFDLHTTFEKPGMYRGWIQFQSGGQIYTADFVFKVEAGSSDAVVSEHSNH